MLFRRTATKVNEDEVARYWNRNARAWTAGLRSHRDVWNEVFGIPRFLRFVGPVAGLSVLDAGCGEGRSARHLARRGARVTAVDISSGMLDHARHEEAREPLGIRYFVRQPEDLCRRGLRCGDLDHGADGRARSRRFNARVRPRAAFMILHPCFITPGFGKARDRRGRRARLQVGRYCDEAPFVEHWSFPGGDAHRSEFAVPRFPRTLARYVNGVVGAGLDIAGIEDPRPSAEEHACHRWLDFWRHAAALYPFVRAVKPDHAHSS
ncbi:MAG: class I SAM-dependent methyltransferase [Geminicoccaceae bacterium]